MLGAAAGAAEPGVMASAVLTPDGVGAAASIAAGAVAGTVAGAAVGITASVMDLIKDFGLEDRQITLTMVLVDHGIHVAIILDA